MRNKILFAALLLLTSSCAVYRTYKTPPIESSKFVGEGVTASDSTVVIPSWKDFFVDKNLQDLIEHGLVSNSDMRIARQNIVQAEAVLLSSKLAYLPSFALSPEGTVANFKNNGMTSYALPLTTQWEIDLSGKIKNTKEQVQIALLQTEEYVKMTQTQLVAAIANGYYTLVMLDEQFDITKESIAIQKSNIETIKALKDVGLQTETAVNQAEADYFNVVATLSELEKQIRSVENSVALLVNLPPQTITRSRFDNLVECHFVALYNEVPLSILSNRPDVKVAEYELGKSFYGVNIARGAFYPSLNLSGSLGWTNNAGAIVNPGSLLLSAIGSLTQPLFNKGINKANLKIAQSQYEQALISFEKALLVAGNEVNGALNERQKSSEKLLIRKKQIEANQKAYINSIETMKHSSATYLEVLTAQHSLLQAQLIEVSDWFEYMRGSINLYKSIGGGIE